MSLSSVILLAHAVVTHWNKAPSRSAVVSLYPDRNFAFSTPFTFLAGFSKPRAAARCFYNDLWMCHTVSLEICLPNYFLNLAVIESNLGRSKWWYGCFSRNFAISAFLATMKSTRCLRDPPIAPTRSQRIRCKLIYQPHCVVILFLALGLSTYSV